MQLNFEPMKDRSRFSLSIALAMLLAMNGMSQDQGTLRLLVSPGHDFKVRVDGGAVQQVRELTLATGVHQLSVWAPGHLMRDTVVTVVKDVRTDVILTLAVDPREVEYAQQLMAYKGRSRRTKLLPVATVGMAVYTGAALAAYNKEVEAYNALQDEYRLATIPAEITQLRTVTLPEREAAMDRYSRRMVIGGVSTVALAGLSTYVILRASRRNAPVRDERERSRFEGLVVIPDQSSGTWTVHLQLRLR